MRQYEPFKRLFRIGSAAILMGVITGIYGCVWNGYFNKLIEFPFWRRGNWLMIALYAGLLFFFLMTYGGFRIGYLKKGNLLCSQILSIGLLNVITYIQISLLDKKFHDPKILTAMTLVQLLTAIVWTMLLVCGDRPAFHLMEKINSREDKYYLAKAIHIRAGMDAIIREAQEFDALIIGDIPAKDRNALLKKCFERDIRTYTVPKLSDILIRTSEELDIFDSPLLLSRNEDISGMQRFWKRALDVVCSGAGLVVLSPFFLLVALSIYLTDRGPVFYKQTRLTEGGKEFQICKFRTMIQNAEEKSGARLASENDDRILPIGHFLRRTRLDELPQLFNILKGDMTVVGPRPEMLENVEKYTEELPEFSYRLRMKAGLTGLAQISGKYNTSPKDKLVMDLMYIENYSIWMDIKLIFQTITVFLKASESTEAFGSQELYDFDEDRERKRKAAQEGKDAPKEGEKGKKG